MVSKYMDNKKDDKYYAQKSIENIEAIQNYIGKKSYEEFMADQELNDAVMFRLVQLIENLKNISQEFKDDNPSIPWGDVIGFRNGIVHEYGETDYTVVYEVITQDMEPLKVILLQIA